MTRRESCCCSDCFVSSLAVLSSGWVVNVLLWLRLRRFEFTVSLVELHRRTLDVAVKNGGGLLSKHKGLLGKVLTFTRQADKRVCCVFYIQTSLFLIR